jgi:hypothetical protein
VLSAPPNGACGHCDLDPFVVEESHDLQRAAQRLDVLRERREVNVSPTTGTRIEVVAATSSCSGSGN